MNAPAPAKAPDPFAWDTADRMRKALRVSGVSIEEMASYLGVSRRSVGNWINGRIDPSVQTLRLWALRTGAPLEWLHHGNAGTPCDFTTVTVLRLVGGTDSPRSEKMHSHNPSSVA